MKSVSTKTKNFYLLVSGLIFSLTLISYSIYNILNNSSVTSFTLIFGYSLFFLLGFIYYFIQNLSTLKSLISSGSFITYSSILNKIIVFSLYILFILILLSLNKSLYTKSFIYYLLASLASVVIGFQILCAQNISKKYTYSILFFEIIPLAIIIRISSFIINPYLIGPDVPSHFHYIQDIVSCGFLSKDAFHYYYYPSYHLIQTIGASVIGLSDRNFNLINLITSLVAVVIAYLLGIELFNNYKAGLFSALLFSISTVNIFLIFFNTSKIGGCTLFLLCFFLIVKILKGYTNPIIMHVIFWISAAALFLWHPELSIAMMAMLLGFSFSEFTERKIQLTAFMLYLVAFTGYLIYVHSSLFTYIMDCIFIEGSAESMVQNVNVQRTQMTQTTQTIHYLLIFELFFSYLGITLPNIFSTYGLLKWTNNLNKIYSFVLFFFIALHLIPIIGILSENSGLYPSREFTYVCAISLIITSGFLVEIFNSTSKGKFLFVIIFFIFSLFSLSSYLIGDGSNIFNNEIPRQTTFATESALESSEFLSKTPDKSRIIGDYETLRYISDSQRGFFGLSNRIIMTFSSKILRGYYVFNIPNLRRSNFDYNTSGIDPLNNNLIINKLYNNGNLLIISN